MCDGLEGKRCDYEGHLVTESGVNTLTDCVAKCNNNAQCSHVSYASSYGKQCVLFYKCNKKHHDKNFSSQQMGCSYASKLFIKYIHNFKKSKEAFGSMNKTLKKS